MGKLKRVRVNESTLQFDHDFFNQMAGSKQPADVNRGTSPSHDRYPLTDTTFSRPSPSPPVQAETPQSPPSKRLYRGPSDDEFELQKEQVSLQHISEHLQSSESMASQESSPRAVPEVIDLVDSDSSSDSILDIGVKQQAEEQRVMASPEVSLQYICVIPGHEVTGHLELRSDRSLRPLDEIFEPELDDYVFVHDGSRVYSFAKPEVLAPGQTNLIITVMTTGQFADAQDRASSDAGSELGLDDSTVAARETLTIKIISQARHPIEVGVSHDTPMHKIAAYFLEKSNLPLATKVRLEFDHEPLDLEDTVSSLDMEDGDCLDCFVS